jgi:hypothetical protein
MSDDDLRRDMRAMRAQLAESSAARTAATPDDTGASPPEQPAPGPSPVPDSDAEEEIATLQDELDKLLENLDNELSDIPTATAVGIFALGVLLGRLLPR